MRNKSIRPRTVFFIFQCLLAFTYYGCAEHAAQESKGGANTNTIECLIPGQIRQLDDRTTIPTQRQVIRVTKEECKAQGGEQQSPP